MIGTTRVDGLAGREPHREVRARRRDDDRLLQDRRAALDPVDVDRRQSPGAEVELVGGRRVGGHCALGGEHRGAVRQAAPATGLVGPDLDQVREQRRREPAAFEQQPVEGGDEHVERVQRRTAVHARVQVALSRRAPPDGGRPCRARSDVEDGRVGVEHPRVEDHARSGVAGVLVEEVDDRRAADLLLGVAAKADVDGQAPFARKVERCAQERPELTLVVGDAAGVEPAVADLGRERVALPQLERRRRLNVEVPVTDDRRRLGGVLARGDERVDEGSFALLHDRRLPAAAPDELGDPVGRGTNIRRPVRVGADARDPQELGQLGQPASCSSVRESSVNIRVPAFCYRSLATGVILNDRGVAVSASSERMQYAQALEGFHRLRPSSARRRGRRVRREQPQVGERHARLRLVGRSSRTRRRTDLGRRVRPRDHPDLRRARGPEARHDERRAVARNEVEGVRRTESRGRSRCARASSSATARRSTPPRCAPTSTVGTTSRARSRTRVPRTTGRPSSVGSRRTTRSRAPRRAASSRAARPRAARPRRST